MVTTWVAVVETLALVAGNYLQAAYAGFTFSLQNEWQYVQCVTSDTAAHFAPLEVAIRTKFLPALLGIAASDLDGEFRELLTQGVKTGGIAIWNPVDTAVHIHETSLRATSHLVISTNSANNEHAPMDYHAQMTYATNQPNLVKTQSLALGWISMSIFKQIITSRRMHGLLTTNVVLDSLSTVLHTRLNRICSLLKYGFPVASTISRSQTHQRMDFAVPLDRVGMRLLLMESLSTPVYRHSFSTPTPSINTLQQIELTITKAFAIHIRYAQ